MKDLSLSLFLSLSFLSLFRLTLVYVHFKIIFDSLLVLHKSSTVYIKWVVKFETVS